jgi:hypothetical protein
MKLTGKTRGTRGKTCRSDTLSTTNPTLNGPGSQPDHRGERAATNCLSHGAAKHFIHFQRVIIFLRTRETSTSEDKRTAHTTNTCLFMSICENSVTRCPAHSASCSTENWRLSRSLSSLFCALFVLVSILKTVVVTCQSLLL